MSDIKLSATGDLDLATMSLRLATGGEAIAQEIQIACRFFLREWKLDERVGIDLLGRVLGIKGVTPDEVAVVYRQALLSIPGVLQVDFVRATVDATRVGTVQWRVVTDATVVPIEGQEALVLQ